MLAIIRQLVDRLFPEPAAIISLRNKSDHWEETDLHHWE